MRSNIPEDTSLREYSERGSGRRGLGTRVLVFWTCTEGKQVMSKVKSKDTCYLDQDYIVL
jgi:hypothetical protein